MITIYSQKDQRKLNEVLPQVMMAYRAASHPSIGVSPNKMVLGRNVVMPLEAIGPRPKDNSEAPETDEYVLKLQENLAKVHELARNCLKQNSNYQKKYYDSKAEVRKFYEGQSVWLYDASKKVGVCSKLTCKWKGPYVITKKIDDVTCLVKRSEKQPEKVYHTDFFRTRTETHLNGTRVIIYSNEINKC